MTTNDTPTAEQLIRTQLEYITESPTPMYGDNTSNIETICESYLSLLDNFNKGREMFEESRIEVVTLKQQLKIAKEALESIADKECNHAYPSKVMVDICEACKARVTISKLTI